jgi:hypothetical protein
MANKIPSRANNLRQNNIVEILTQMGWNFKPLFDQATWHNESSWLTLSTIQTCIPSATQEDMNTLVAKGLVKTSDEVIGFAIVKQSEKVNQ